MKTKLHWQMRDLSLYGLSMLAKTVGVSQLIYAASLLTVPKAEIQKTQAEPFAFLWKNKKGKIKRQVIVTKRELKKINITADDQCNLCSKTDSILHTFLECDREL